MRRPGARVRLRFGMRELDMEKGIFVGGKTDFRVEMATGGGEGVKRLLRAFSRRAILYRLWRQGFYDFSLVWQ